MQSFDIIYDDEKFEEAVTVLEFYAEDHKIKYHTYKIHSLYQLKLILNKKDRGEEAVILTNSPEKFEHINYKKIYINKNPFSSK